MGLQADLHLAERAIDQCNPSGTRNQVVMAAKRVSSTAINWAELAKKVPDGHRVAFQSLKMMQDGYLRSINSLPEKLPAIDWAAYKGRVAPAMVDDFQKKYEALQVPYPKDTTASAIAAEAGEVKAAHEQFVSESNARIASFTEELAKWEKMMPIEDMNLEEAMQAAPQLVPQMAGVTGKQPMFWPFEKEYDPEVKRRAKEEYERTYWDH